MTSCAVDDNGTRCSRARPFLPFIRSAGMMTMVAVNFRPRQLRALVEPQPGEQ